MRQTVLCYNLKGTKKGRKLGMIFSYLGFKVHHILPEEYHIPVGELAEGKTDAETKSEETDGEEPFTDEMLILCPASEASLDKALFMMRKEKVQVPLKAVLTPSNQEWDSVSLHDEILKEHKAMCDKTGN